MSVKVDFLLKFASMPTRDISFSTCYEVHTYLIVTSEFIAMEGFGECIMSKLTSRWIANVG